MYPNYIQTHNGSKERYLLGQIHNLQIFGVISFIKLQNDIKRRCRKNDEPKNEMELTEAHLSVLESLFAG